MNKKTYIWIIALFVLISNSYAFTSCLPDDFTNATKITPQIITVNATYTNNNITLWNWFIIYVVVVALAVIFAVIISNQYETLMNTEG